MGPPLALLPSHRGDRFPLPHKSLNPLHAAFMPDAAQAVNRLPPALIPQVRLHQGFDIICTLSTHHQRFTFVRLFNPYLIGSRPTFPISLTTTSLKCSSSGSLVPVPARRHRGPFPHLLCSMAAQGLMSLVRAFVAHSRRRSGRSCVPGVPALYPFHPAEH